MPCDADDRAFTNMWFFNLFTILELHHEEIVDNGLVTYDQDGKSCNIVLQTKTKNYMCSWQLSDKNILGRYTPKMDSKEYLKHFQHFKSYGFTSADYSKFALSGQLDIAKFATYPRAYTYWLENIATKSQRITNVTCETENETVLAFRKKKF